MIKAAPDFQDEVVHTGGTIGTVIATYTLEGVPYLDVRGLEDRIYYKTLASNWTVIRMREEIEGTPE